MHTFLEWGRIQTGVKYAERKIGIPLSKTDAFLSSSGDHCHYKRPYRKDEKRVSSFMPAMVFVCVFSTAGFEFRFPVQDGTYKLENVEQKQGELIDGKAFLTA